MIFKIFMTIVFISEIIITLFLINYLRKIDKNVIAINAVITETKPKISEISNLCTKISGQMVEFSEIFVDKIKNKKEEYLYTKILKLILTLMFWKKFKMLNKMKKLKVFKGVQKGLSLLQNMV